MDTKEDLMLLLLVLASLLTCYHQAPLAKRTDGTGKLRSGICRNFGGLDRTKQLLQKRNWGLKSFAGNAVNTVVFTLFLDVFRQAEKLEFVGI